MPFDIRTLSNVERTEANLKELIVACRARGPLYCHDTELTNDVMRKAKGLQTSLGKLKAAVDDFHHKPLKEEQMPQQDPLNLRLFFQAHMTELARFVSYGGRKDADLREKCDDMRKRFPEGKVAMALHELTMRDPKTELTVLRPDVRKLCKGLLGPAPEDDDYQRYWDINKRTPPPEHQPPAPEVAEEETKPVKKRGRSRG